MSRPRTTLVVAVSVIALGLVAGAGAQPPRPGPAAPPPAPRAAAPIDLTGYWVSIVTQDWRWRMVTPRKGDYEGVPLTPEGRAAADTWDPAKDEAAGEQCRSYGAPAAMYNPGRLHITWQDDNTLKVDMDSGTQTRLFHFNATVPPNTPKSLQGYSVATWETGGRGGGGFGGGGGGRGGAAAPAAPRWGSLKVVTTNLNGGYLLSSRDTYSDNAVLTENFTRHSDFGLEYFTVTAVIEDGGNPRVTSSTFKKEPNGSKFAPTGCEIVK